MATATMDTRRWSAVLLAALATFMLIALTPARPALFKGKVAVIAGSSYGLGRELALLAVGYGMPLVLVDMRPQHRTPVTRWRMSATHGLLRR